MTPLMESSSYVKGCGPAECFREASQKLGYPPDALSNCVKSFLIAKALHKSYVLQLYSAPYNVFKKLGRTHDEKLSRGKNRSISSTSRPTSTEGCAGRLGRAAQKQRA